jgi:transporter family protein
MSVALAIILAFIFLGEKPTWGSLIGGALVIAGALVLVFVK